jgi:hypothetical protein
VSVEGSAGAVVTGVDSAGMSLLVITGEPSVLEGISLLDAISVLDDVVPASETGQTVVETATV